MIRIDDLERKNFRAGEFIGSLKALELGIDNRPKEQATLKNLMLTASMMQRVREALEKPITITSGFRSKEVNDAVGGSKTSKHLLGLACDFICPSFGNPEKIVRYLKEIDFNCDVCLIETTWVHIHTKENVDDNRKMFGFWDIKNKKFEAI